MGDLHATTLAVLKSLGHFPNWYNVVSQHTFQIHVHLYEQFRVKTKNTYFNSEGKL